MSARQPVDLTPDEVKRRAEAWFDKQMADAERAHGPENWAKHRDWVADYLRQEIRERLEARGWRRKA